MFFRSWATFGRIVVVGTLTYIGFVPLLRITGQRTLSKMNAFDLVVTVALGSTLATVLLSKDSTLVDGIVALALLIGLQFSITWLSVRSSTVGGLVKASPSLVEGSRCGRAGDGRRLLRDQRECRSLARDAAEHIEL